MEDRYLWSAFALGGVVGCVLTTLYFIAKRKQEERDLDERVCEMKRAMDNRKASNIYTEEEEETIEEPVVVNKEKFKRKEGKEVNYDGKEKVKKENDMRAPYKEPMTLEEVVAMGIPEEEIKDEFEKYGMVYDDYCKKMEHENPEPFLINGDEFKKEPDYGIDKKMVLIWKDGNIWEEDLSECLDYDLRMLTVGECGIWENELLLHGVAYIRNYRTATDYLLIDPSFPEDIEPPEED